MINVLREWDNRLRYYLRGNKLVKLIYDVWSYPHIPHLITPELKNAKTILDLGCGRRNIFSGIDRNRDGFLSVGVDMDKGRLLEARQADFHDNFIMANVMTLEFTPKSFDVVLAIDLIEHLTKEEGFRLIEKMESIAKGKVIIVTPNGFEQIRGDTLRQVHKCGWEFSELKERGYTIKGLWGLKILRPMRRYTVLWPLWGIISGLTQKLTYFFPGIAGAIFAVKETA